MKYTTPEVSLLGRSVDVVQMHTKGGQELDSAEPTYTTSAYEVDE
jgi:hypothetical protein